MKKLTSLLLTAVLLISAIQSVCAAQTANQIEAAIPQASDNSPSASEQDSQNLPSSEPTKEEIGRIVSPDQADVIFSTFGLELDIDKVIWLSLRLLHLKYTDEL